MAQRHETSFPAVPKDLPAVDFGGSDDDDDGPEFENDTEQAMFAFGAKVRKDASKEHKSRLQKSIKKYEEYSKRISSRFCRFRNERTGALCCPHPKAPGSKYCAQHKSYLKRKAKVQQQQKEMRDLYNMFRNQPPTTNEIDPDAAFAARLGALGVKPLDVPTQDPAGAPAQPQVPAPVSDAEFEARAASFLQRPRTPVLPTAQSPIVAPSVSVLDQLQSGQGSAMTVAVPTVTNQTGAGQDPEEEQVDITSLFDEMDIH